MKHLVLAITILTACFAQPEPEQQKSNILLICIDDLRPELPSFGKDYIHAPNMEKLFKQGRLFKRHYVQAPTCGASRFALLSGICPSTKKQLSNDSIIHHNHQAEPTFPAWFKSHGYTTVAVGKVSHYPGGQSGKNWSDPNKPEIPNAWTRNISGKELSAEWKYPQALMHGYANGKARERGVTPVIEALADARYPDDAITDAALRQIDLLANHQENKKPWLLAVGFIRPHLPFACNKKYLDLYEDKQIPDYSTPKPAKGEIWHNSGEFNAGYKIAKNPNKDAAYAELLRKHYAACTSSTDDHIGTILKKLADSGLDKNTIIVLWGDHGWHLGEKQIWGKHTLYEVALHSPFFIKAPSGKEPGKATDRIVESIDLYPTLCRLAAIPKPKHLQGKCLFTLIKNANTRTIGIARSYWGNKRSEITASEHRIYDNKSNKLLQHYNLQKDPKELNNLIKKQ